MSAPHLQTTPIPLSKSHSSRSLIPTPPQENRRRLVFGSSRKESHSQGTGYGIVSASGFRTWRRGVKGSTSASASASASAGSTTVRGTSRSGATSCVGTGTGKKGLGMGLQGTPARKRVRRDSSRKSKTSIGTQSTPKSSLPVSRRTTTTFTQLDASTSISQFSSETDLISSLDSDPLLTSTSDVIEDGNSDSFAVGAEPIIGEDVFGLTYSIDPDGTVRAVSPLAVVEGSPVPYEFEDPERDVDGEVEDQQNVQKFEKEQYGLELDYRDDQDTPWQDMDIEVPVDFGDTDSTPDTHENKPEGPDTTIRPLQEIDSRSGVTGISEYETRFWDITVPIRETSVLSPLTGSSHLESGQNDSGSEYPANPEKRTKVNDISKPLEVDDGVVPGRERRHSKEKGRGKERSTASRSEATPVAGQLESPVDVEQSRGLKLSKLGAGMIDMSPIQIDDQEIDNLVADAETPKNEVTEACEEEVQEEVTEEVEVDYASRVPRPSFIPKPGEGQGILDFRSVSSSSSISSSILDSGDPLGFKRAERHIKRQRPRTWRATSSPTPPPPGRALSTLSYTSSRSPSPPSITDEEEPVQPATYEPKRGIWKGGRRRTRAGPNANMKTRRREGTGDTSMSTEGDDFSGSSGLLVKKVFIEPEYSATAKRARDARVAHYQDLASNYTLRVESVYF